jgi:hypothetical protein
MPDGLQRAGLRRRRALRRAPAPLATRGPPGRRGVRRVGRPGRRAAAGVALRRPRRAERHAALGVPARPVGRDRRAPAHPRQRTAPRRLAHRPDEGLLDRRARCDGGAHAGGAPVRDVGAGPPAPGVRRSRQRVAQGRLGHARVRQATGLPRRLHADQPAVATRAGQAVGPRAGALGARRLHPPARSPRSASCRARCAAATTAASIRSCSGARRSRCSWRGSRARTARGG